MYENCYNPINLCKGESVLEFQTPQAFASEFFDILFKDCPRGYIHIKLFLDSHTTYKWVELEPYLRRIDLSNLASIGIDVEHWFFRVRWEEREDYEPLVHLVHSLCNALCSHNGVSKPSLRAAFESWRREKLSIYLLTHEYE